MSETKELAEITKVRLGLEGHGLLTLTLTLDYENGWSQCYGNYSYEYEDSETKEIIGHPLLAEHVYALLDAFSVDELNKLVGKKCWVYLSDGSHILRIESLRKEKKKTVDLRKLADKSYERVKEWKTGKK